MCSSDLRFEPLNFIRAVWLSAEKPNDLKTFVDSRKNQIVTDSDGTYVYLAETQWSLDREIKEHPEISFHFISEF